MKNKLLPYLKEGGYEGPSIVDYLNSIGRSDLTSKSMRKKLANAYGIKNYDYSADKNTELLNFLRSANKLPKGVTELILPPSNFKPQVSNPDIGLRNVSVDGSIPKPKTTKPFSKRETSNLTAPDPNYMKFINPADIPMGFKEYKMSTPNIRSEKDESFKKGHSLKNEASAVVLHHTGMEDTTGISKGMSKAMSQVNYGFNEPDGNSAHTVIDFDGSRYKYAEPDQVTFHAGKSMFNGREHVNDFGLGVEFQGNTEHKPLTDKQVQSFIEYIEPIMKNRNIPLSSVTTHKAVRAAYNSKYPKQKVTPKGDLSDSDYTRIIEALKQRGIKQKGGVITDPMGQWAHPGKVTRIPSNQITMKGVPIVMLGVSNTGDVRFMKPGGEYPFHGNSVTEYPLMQNGGEGPIQFLNSYYQSDMFKKRAGVPDQDLNYFKEKTSSLRKTKVRKEDKGSHYDSESHRIILDPEQAKKYNLDLYNDVLPHEYAHAVRKLGMYDEGKFALKHNNPKLAEVWETLIQQGKDLSDPQLSLSIASMKGIDAHDYAPNELYSDLTTLRWLLYKNGIYDTRKKNLDINTLNKGLENKNIKDSMLIKRLLKAYTPEKIVELNNEVAKTSSKSNNAQLGGKLNSNQLWFSEKYRDPNWAPQSLSREADRSGDAMVLSRAATQEQDLQVLLEQHRRSYLQNNPGLDMNAYVQQQQKALGNFNKDGDWVPGPAYFKPGRINTVPVMVNSIASHKTGGYTNSGPLFYKKGGTKKTK